ncbi:MAG: outer membrane protein [Planctomycetaceae bacterium]
MRRIVVVTAVALAAVVARADVAPRELDLSGFATFGSSVGPAGGIGVCLPTTGIHDDRPTLAPPVDGDGIDRDLERYADAVLPDEQRFYIAGLLGVSFATLEVGEPPSIVDQLLTAGAAAGVAFERETGWLRVEFEGRGRDPITETRTDPSFVGGVTATAVGGWSALANVWRDIEITDRLGCYLGGGIGAGGYTMQFSGDVSSPPLPITIQLGGRTGLTGFAWQAGTGVTWALGDRTTLDLGYRFFAVDGGPADVTFTIPPFGTISDQVGTAFSASELMLTIRVYEPFRDWRD